jgi:hypothetical protein
VPKPVEFCGSQPLPSPAYGPSQVSKSESSKCMVCGALMLVLSGMPWLMAEASTKALKVDPAWKPLASPYFFGTT